MSTPPGLSLWAALVKPRAQKVGSLAREHQRRSALQSQPLTIKTARTYGALIYVHLSSENGTLERSPRSSCSFSMPELRGSVAAVGNKSFQNHKALRAKNKTNCAVCSRTVAGRYQTLDAHCRGTASHLLEPGCDPQAHMGSILR